MYQTITLSEFRDSFHRMNRGNQFSYEGLEVLFDYLEEFDNMELDIIALCCEFTECSIDEALKDYDLESIEELENNTLVLKVDDDTIIYQNY